MMDLRLIERRREAIWREVELDHLAKRMRAARRGHADMNRASEDPAREMKRVTDRPLKLLRGSKRRSEGEEKHKDDMRDRRDP